MAEAKIDVYAVVRHFSIVEALMNSLIVDRLAADDALAFELLSENVERIPFDRRIEMLKRILRPDTQWRTESGLADDHDFNAFVVKLRHTQGHRNTIAHAVIVEPGERNGEPAALVGRVRNGRTANVPYSLDDVLAIVEDISELATALQRLWEHNMKQKARWAALRRRAAKR